VTVWTQSPGNSRIAPLLLQQIGRRWDHRVIPKKKVALSDDNVLVSAAKAVGSTAGKIAALAGVKPKPPESRLGRFVKTLKARLPRKVKKAAQKKAAKRTETSNAKAKR